VASCVGFASVDGETVPLHALVITSASRAERIAFRLIMFIVPYQ
jgi:hypothetical protein